MPVFKVPCCSMQYHSFFTVNQSSVYFGVESSFLVKNHIFPIVNQSSIAIVVQRPILYVPLVFFP